MGSRGGGHASAPGSRLGAAAAALAAAERELDEVLGSRGAAAEVRALLERASWRPPGDVRDVVPLGLATRIVERGRDALARDPPVVALPAAKDGTLTVVGDVHGQFHDVARIFDECGPFTINSPVVFNGDFCDRGNWGLELVLLLLAHKAESPDAVFLLRGNHETAYCHDAYGFRRELETKYGVEMAVDGSPSGLWRLLLDAFAKLPYAATAARNSGHGVCVIHGGLFRAPDAGAGSKRRRGAKSRPGTLSDLERASRATEGGGDEPLGMGAERLLSDALWSDPSHCNGMEPNADRGIGCRFGPDATAEFLRANGCRLLVRGHEGPDARSSRLESDEDDPLGQALEVFNGLHCDHRWPDSMQPSCVTVFSAPGYPQHEPEFHRPAGVLQLHGPAYSSVDSWIFKQWDEPAPRPRGEPFYDLDTPGSDVQGPDPDKSDAAYAL